MFQLSYFEHVKFMMHQRHSSGDIKESVKYKNWKFEKHSYKQDIPQNINNSS